MSEQRACRRVVFLVFPGVQALDLVGPMEVFHGASQLASGAYSVEIVASGARPVASSSGLLIQPAVDLSGPR